MTTYQTIIDRVRTLYLMTGTSDRINVLDGNINNITDTLQLRYDFLGVANGSRLSIGTEDFFVIDTSGTTAGSNVTVLRGYNGSAAATHNDGDLVRINAEYSDYAILTAMNECIDTLVSDGLYKVGTLEFDFIPSRSGYDLPVTTPPGIIDILQVRYDTPGPENNWPIIPPQLWIFDNTASTTEFPSGHSLVLKAGGHPGFPVRVAYKTTFTTSTNTSDSLEAVVGLMSTSLDIPQYGAAMRLNAGRDIKRTFLTRQPEPRRQEEVPPGSAQNSIQMLSALYYRAIDREKQVLRRLYPQALY